MKDKDYRVLTYARCENELRKREFIKIANNTVLFRVGKEFMVRLGNSEIIRIHKDGTYTLTSAGQRDRTTKNRLNTLTPARIFSSKGVWYICYLDGCRREFRDGMRIDSKGAVLTNGRYSIAATAPNLMSRAEHMVKHADTFIKELNDEKEAELYHLLSDLQRQRQVVNSNTDWTTHPVCDWLEENGGSKWFVIVLHAY